MYDGKKAMVFGSLGLAFGYFCHRLVLLYDSLPNQPPLERFGYLLGEGQNQVLNPLWNGNFTGRSLELRDETALRSSRSVQVHGPRIGR